MKKRERIIEIIQIFADKNLCFRKSYRPMQSITSSDFFPCSSLENNKNGNNWSDRVVSFLQTQTSKELNEIDLSCGAFIPDLTFWVWKGPIPGLNQCSHMFLMVSTLSGTATQWQPSAVIHLSGPVCQRGKHKMRLQPVQFTIKTKILW